MNADEYETWEERIERAQLERVQRELLAGRITLADGVKRLLASLVEAVDQAPTRWHEGEPPPHSVLKFERALHGSTTTYTYVAYRAPIAAAHHWYVTANRLSTSVVPDTPMRERAARVSWRTLKTMIGDSARCWLASAWVEVPALSEPPQADPDDWARRAFEPRVEPDAS